MASKVVKRWLLFPGYATNSEGKEIYISFISLMARYDIPRNQCVNAESPVELSDLSEDEVAKLLPLRVRPDGDYTLPGRDD